MNFLLGPASVFYNSWKHSPLPEVELHRDFIDGSERFPKLQSLTYDAVNWKAQGLPGNVIKAIIGLVQPFRHPAGGLQGRAFPVLRKLTVRFEVEVYSFDNALILSEKDVQTLKELRAAGLDVYVREYRGHINSGE